MYKVPLEDHFKKSMCWDSEQVTYTTSTISFNQLLVTDYNSYLLNMFDSPDVVTTFETFESNIFPEKYTFSAMSYPDDAARSCDSISPPQPRIFPVLEVTDGSSASLDLFPNPEEDLF